MIAEGIAWFLLWLFAQGVFHKLSAPRYYQQLMGRYLGTAVGTVAPFAAALVEISIVVALLCADFRWAGLAAAAACLLAYAGLMAGQIFNGGAGMDCGCAGPQQGIGLDWALVLRNGVCAGLALLAMSRAEHGAAGLWAALASALVALVAIALYQVSGQIIRHAQWMEGGD